MSSTINLLRSLADETRLRLLLLLEQEELSVAELQEILGMGQSRISAHLAQLKRAGLVEDRRSGKNVYYGYDANNRITTMTADGGAAPPVATSTTWSKRTFASAGA